MLLLTWDRKVEVRSLGEVKSEEAKSRAGDPSWKRREGPAACHCSTRKEREEREKDRESYKGDDYGRTVRSH